MMKLIALSFILFGFPCWAQPSVDLAKPAAGATGGEYGRIPKLPASYDDKATEAVLNRVVQEAGWFPEIKVRVEKGLVLIEGQIEDKTHLDWLVATADRLPTVVAVINKVEIEEVPAANFQPVVTESKRLIEVAKKRLPKFLVGVVLILGFAFLSRFLTKYAKKFWSRHIANVFLVSVVAFICLIPLYALMLYLTLATLGLEGLATTIIGGTGLLGIVVGFAFKGIAENFLAGILLAIRSPFTKGDNIRVGEFEGIVQNLNMRGTTILDPDGNLVLIPNAIVIQSIVMNKTVNPTVRTFFSVGIGYGESVEKAETIIREALKDIPDILDEPPVLIGADNLGSSTIDIKIYYWVNSRKSSPLTVKSDAISLVKAKLLQASIELPDEAREVILKEAKDVSIANPVPPKLIPPTEGAEEDHMKNRNALQKMAESVQLPGNEKSGNIL